MKATDQLMAEHRLIERVLDTLEIAAQAVERDQALRSSFFADAADFIQGFVDGCHHRKEEQVLFKAMAAGGMSSEGGPIALMLAEHELARAYGRALGESASHLAAGSPAASSAVIFIARGYAGLLRQHMVKEDKVLFPLASRVILAPAQTLVADDMEQVDCEATGAGGHEKYVALVEQLEKDMAGL